MLLQRKTIITLSALFLIYLTRPAFAEVQTVTVFYENTLPVDMNHSFDASVSVATYNLDRQADTESIINNVLETRLSGDATTLSELEAEHAAAFDSLVGSDDWADIESSLSEGGTAILDAARNGVEKLPAIVINGSDVIYGVTSMAEAIEIYEEAASEGRTTPQSAIDPITDQMGADRPALSVIADTELMPPPEETASTEPTPLDALPDAETLGLSESDDTASEPAPLESVDDRLDELEGEDETAGSPGFSDFEPMFVTETEGGDGDGESGGLDTMAAAGTGVVVVGAVSGAGSFSAGEMISLDETAPLENEAASEFMEAGGIEDAQATGRDSFANAGDEINERGGDLECDEERLGRFNFGVDPECESEYAETEEEASEAEETEELNFDVEEGVIELDDIITATTEAALSCVDFEVVGICVWLKCAPFYCKVETNLKVKNFVPDLTVQAYHAGDRLPWKESETINKMAMADADSSLIETIIETIADFDLPDGGVSGGDSKTEGTIDLQMRLVDAYGNPALVVYPTLIQAVTLGIACNGPTVPFMPYFISNLDSIGWRWNVPEMFYPQSWNAFMAPGTLKESTMQYYGPIYPRHGFMDQSDEAKAAVLATFRALHIITRSGQPHVYQTIDKAPNDARYWLPDGLDQHDEETGMVQMLYPVTETSCKRFTEGGAGDGSGGLLSVSEDSFSFDFDSISDERRNEVPGLKEGTSVDDEGAPGYVWNFWRKYKCCKRKGQVLLMHTG